MLTPRFEQTISLILILTLIIDLPHFKSGVDTHCVCFVSSIIKISLKGCQISLRSESIKLDLPLKIVKIRSI